MIFPVFGNSSVVRW